MLPESAGIKQKKPPVKKQTREEKVLVLKERDRRLCMKEREIQRSVRELEREREKYILAATEFVVCKVCCYKRVRESERYEKNKKGFPFAFSCSSSSHHTTTTSTTTIQLKVS